MFTALIALAAWFGVTLALHVAVLIYGWGLDPVSWGWIVGGGFFGQILMFTVGDKIVRDFKKAAGDRE